MEINTEQTEGVKTLVKSFITPTLLCVCCFFLSAMYTSFDDVKKHVTNMRIIDTSMDKSIKELLLRVEKIEEAHVEFRRKDAQFWKEYGWVIQTLKKE